jgi:hypothetical protein
MATRWVGIFSLFLCFLLPSWAEKSFRTFRTNTGQPFVGRALSYEGQIFYVQGRDGKLFAIPFKKVSPEDQKYLIQIAPKLPKGDPRKFNRKDDQPPSQSDKKPESSSTEQVKKSDSRPASPQKPKFRPGSFFAYKPINLGQDPGMAVKAETVASLPGPDESVDFDKHILPIMAERCQSCHKAPYDKNGRTIHPKAGLQLNDYESVMKGNLDGTVVEAGKPDESYLYEVITLNEEDDMFMPPKGGALTLEQIDAIKRWIEEGAKPSTGGDSGSVADMSKGISFHDHVFPLLEERCLDCHGEPYVKNGRTIHPKAGLRLDTYEWVIKGNLDGVIIEKGNPDQSTLIAVITLDSDDPEIMPPKGNPLSEDEINLLKQWILEGAKENPSDTFSPPKKEDHADLKVEAKSIIDELSKRLTAPSKPQMEAAQKSGALVSLLSTRHSLVRAEFSSGPNLIKDDAIGALSAIKNNVSHLDLSRTSVTDSVLGEVKKFNNLTWLNLKDTAISDRGIKNLSKMPNLTYLNLVSSKVSDESIETIASIKTLEEIYLWNSNVSEKGVKDLRAVLPNCKIIF